MDRGLSFLGGLGLGSGPKASMSEDLARRMSLIEEGTTRAPGQGTVARQDAAEPAPVAAP